KLDLSNTKGLKKSEIKKLTRLLQERIPENMVLTLDLAESIAEISHETGSAISVVANRRGQIINITVGHPRDVNVP
ncbi:MAG: GTPase HflX, partial [Candidatus Saccharimonadales bacterium]